MFSKDTGLSSIKQPIQKFWWQPVQISHQISIAQCLSFPKWYGIWICYEKCRFYSTFCKMEQISVFQNYAKIWNSQCNLNHKICSTIHIFWDRFICYTILESWQTWLLNNDIFWKIIVLFQCKNSQNPSKNARDALKTCNYLKIYNQSVTVFEVNVLLALRAWSDNSKMVQYIILLQKLNALELFLCQGTKFSDYQKCVTCVAKTTL